jgi:plasmid stabilization system protein ParE
MARLVVSPQADADAAAIVDMLIREAGEAVATRYRRDFNLLFERLAMFPQSGAQRPELGRDIRIGVVHPYVVIYRYDDTTVRIARIVDGRRNITRRVLHR